jgi:hypothetical protein
VAGSAPSAAISIAASIDLDDDEQHLLQAALPDAVLASEAAQLSAPEPAGVDAPDAVDSWQYSLDVDPSSVLVLALTSASAAVAEEATRQLGDQFWLGVKTVLGRVRRRKAGAPVSSVQLRAPLPPAAQLPADLSLTALHAEYVDDASWAQTMTAATAAATAQRDRAIAAIAGPDGRIPDHVVAAGSRVVVYGFVEGSGTFEWHTELESA